MGHGPRQAAGVALATAVLAFTTICAARSADAPEAAGERLVAAKCAACHAVGRTGASPLDKAPPFRTLHRKYPVAYLAEALAEGITTGHNEMPEFVFSTEEIAAIVAYLETIADGPPGKP
ncbi:MAG: cytochrome c [Hyphomicrobiaceae bacterium]